MIWLIVGGVVALWLAVGVVALGLCKAAAAGDRNMELEAEQARREHAAKHHGLRLIPGGATAPRE